MVLLASGCVSRVANLSADTADRIPAKADVVIIGNASLATIDAIYAELVRRNATIAREDKERGVLVTEFFDVGQETYAQLQFALVDGTVRGTGKWTISDSGAIMFGLNGQRAGETALWTGGRPGVAFAAIVEIANAVSDDVSYGHVTTSKQTKSVWDGVDNGRP